MTIFNEKIVESRKAKGLTQQQVADALGVTRAAVGQWESAYKTPTTENLLALCKLLDVDLSEIEFRRIEIIRNYIPSAVDDYEHFDPLGLSRADRSIAQPNSRLNSNVALAPNMPMEAAEAQIYLPLDVPVLGVSMGGDGHDFQFNGETVDHVRRPLGIAKARRAYATFVIGESMVPAYREGSVVFVNPDRPPSIGDDVIIELHPLRDGEPGPGYIKRLKKRTSVKIVVEQFNPPKDLEFDLDEVKAMHRVVPWNELLGV